MEGVVEGHVYSLVDEVVGNVGSVTVADIGGDITGVIILYVREGEFARTRPSGLEGSV